MLLEVALIGDDHVAGDRFKIDRTSVSSLWPSNLPCVFLTFGKKMLTSLFLLLAAAVNMQTREEVAVISVLDSIPSMSLCAQVSV